MIVRPYQAEDLKAIEELHRRMGFNYQMPAFNRDPAIYTGVIADGENILAAAHLRKDAEVYLWVDLQAPASARWKAIQALDRECCPILKNLGFSQTVAWIPREIEWEFTHALVKLGFSRARSSFAAWSKEL